MLRRTCATLFVLALACRGEPPPREPAVEVPAKPPADSGSVDAPRANLPSLCPLVPSRTEPLGVAGVYRRRRDGATGTEIWEHRAAGVRPSGSVLIERLDSEQRERLNAVSGVNGHGIAMCCDPGRQVGYSCLLVTAEPSELDAEQLARALAAVFERADDLDYEVIVFAEGLAH